MNLKFLFSLMCFVFLFGSVTAVNWDNSISYSDNDLTVTFKNSFGLGGEIGTAKLISHKTVDEIRYLIAGSNYQPVMIYKFDFENDHTNGLGDVKFIDMTTGFEITNKSFYFAEKINDEWVKMDTTTIPAGKREIALMTIVEKGDYMDGQWKIAGKYVKKHSTWTDSLSINLRAFYTFNETSGILEDLVSGINGSQIGDVDLGETGVISNAVRVDTFGSPNPSIYMNSTGQTYGIFSSGTSGTNGYTVNSWLKFGSMNANTRFIDMDAESNVQFNINGANTSITWVSDANTMHIDVPSLNTWYMFTFMLNMSGMFGYRDGTLVATDSFDVPSTPSSLQRNLLKGDDSGIFYDEYGLWNRSLNHNEIVQLYNSGSGLTYPGPPPANVQLITPVNGTLTNADPLIFNCTGQAPHANPITKATLWSDYDGIGWKDKNTTGTIWQEFYEHVTVVNSSEIANANNHVWNCAFELSNGSTLWATNNFSFSFDDKEPRGVVHYPNGTVNWGQIGTDQYINFTVNDTYLDTCVLTYGGTNYSSSNGDFTCASNTTTNFTITLLENDYNVSVWVNDTLGNGGSGFTPWTYHVVQLNESFANFTISGATEEFEAHVHTSNQISTVTQWYNNSAFTGTFQSLGQDRYKVSNSVIIPEVPVSTVKHFKWDFKLNGGFNINGTLKNHTINPLQVGLCQGAQTPILNYTLYDEESLELLGEGVIELDVSVFALDYSTVIATFNHTYTNVTSACFGMNLTGGNFYIDSTAKYYNTYNLTNVSKYAVEHYYIRKANVSLTSPAMNISLYDILEQSSTRFLINVKGLDFLPLVDALISVTRYYVGDGVFRTVELPITDYAGQAVAHLRKDDTVYTFLVRKNNQLLGTFENLIPVCENELTEECVINLNLLQTSSTPQDFYHLGGLQFNLDYDENTGDLTSLFTTDSGTPVNFTMIAIVDNRFGNQTICSDSLSSSSGALLCNVPSTFDNSTALVTLYSDGNIVGQTSFSLFQRVFDKQTNTNNMFIYLILLAITIPFMFITSLVGMVIGGIIAVILMTLMLFGTGNATVTITAGVAWLIVAGGILIWKLQKGGGAD